MKKEKCCGRCSDPLEDTDVPIPCEDCVCHLEECSRCRKIMKKWFNQQVFTGKHCGNCGAFYPNLTNSQVDLQKNIIEKTERKRIVGEIRNEIKSFIMDEVESSQMDEDTKEAFELEEKLLALPTLDPCSFCDLLKSRCNCLGSG